ncbi:choice-of-anchor B family protein [Flavobacteriales bacterium]|nr:choice-of-anchor B family protein [Flavobacteriales bacterium]
MKRIILVLMMPLMALGQSNFNLSLVGSYEWPTTEGSDIWGWVDGSGNEYALVGLNDGFACVNVSNPTNPVQEFYISDINSTWRDVKTWGNFAYITTEADAGLLIVDLTDMTGSSYSHVSNFTHPTNGSSVEFTAAHNIYIDENGIAYIFGASSATGGSPSDGAIFLDVAANATAPVYLGEWDDEYIHDGMVRGDTMYAGCIYAGELFVVDVSDKNNPNTLGTHSTPNAFTHNAWISDDGDFVFTTDEKSDAYLAAYDITDLNNIQEVDRIQSNPGELSIPHNTHVDGNFLITSYYRDGTTVHDITHPNNMIQVAHYDSYSGAGNGFDGCWGTYPFLPSGLIISSEINSSANQSAKLMIYERGFVQACYLEGNITDATNGNNLSGASVEILNTPINNNSTSNLLGYYGSGTANPAIYDVVFSKPGYLTDTLQTTLLSGQVVILNAILYIDNNVPILGCTNPSASNYNPNANTSLEFGGELDNTFGSGGFFSGNQHLIFDAYEDLLIKSAIFYADNPTTVTFELRNNAGIVIDDTTHSLISGQQQLILNFDTPIGNDFQLGISSGNSDLYRNDDNAVYPYNIGSIMSITNTSAGSPGYYYFYYNIEVEVPCETITTTINEFNSNKKLTKIVDVLGRDVGATAKTPLFYIYDDGTVEKRIIIE